jgi:glycine cleavage system aminomethyltransferase T
MIGGVTAIRQGVARSDRGVAVVACRGEGAGDVLDRVVTCDLYLRDGQARPALILDEGGDITADVLVLAEDDGFVLLVDGMPAEAVCDVLSAHRRGEDAAFEPADRLVIGVDGPFAWELMAAFDTPGVIGLPYLTAYRPQPDVCVIRAGRTGEFGYDIVVPTASAGAVRDRLDAVGAAFELAVASTEALSYCALENFFFDAGTERRPGVGPLELQLQWRLSRRKGYLGSGAVDQRRASRDRRRAVAFRAPAVPSGAVRLGDRTVGDVLRASPSLHGDGAIGLALVDLAVAHSGIDALTAGVPLRTVSPPFVANRSLFVKPQQHSWADRATIPFPP